MTITTEEAERLAATYVSGARSIVATALQSLAAERDALRQERDGANALVERMHEQDVLAIKAWQAAHPGSELTWPSSARLSAWCMGEVANVTAERDALRASKDAAYEERNRVVALLAAAFPSVRARTAIEGWSEDWHGCIYITLPTGQASWHYHDSHANLFAHVPEGAAIWDGHTTPEKYERVAAACAERDALKAEVERLSTACDNYFRQVSLMQMKHARHLPTLEKRIARQRRALAKLYRKRHDRKSERDALEKTALQAAQCHAREMKRADGLQAENARLREVLEDIKEYWNGAQESAVDAAEECQYRAGAALGETQ